MQVVEHEIARIGRRQDNVITGDQLRAAGLTRGAIAHRLEARALQRMHKNVFLLGAAPPTPLARARAAVLACGADAVASHRSGACLFGLLPEIEGADVHVTVGGRNPGEHPGIRLHRVAKLRPGDVTTISGLNVTPIARTICDLAATESARDTEHAFQEALFRDKTIDRAIAAVLAREPRRRGAPVIRSLLHDPRLTRSDRERRILKLIAQAQLPRPLTNVPLHGYVADVFWPEHNLILEFDGWQGHGHRLAFESNRKRDQVMLAAGLRTLRVTDCQLTMEPIALTTRIAQTMR
jgi:very-short-patch-repair endonuclease